jgi:hypothetical protein
MATRLYLNSDLAAMAGKLPQNIGQPNRSIQWPPHADFVAGQGSGRSFLYAEATARAWCDHYGFGFVALPDVETPKPT